MSPGRVAHRWSTGYSVTHRVWSQLVPSTGLLVGVGRVRSGGCGPGTLLGPEETGRLLCWFPLCWSGGVSAGRGGFLRCVAGLVVFPGVIGLAGGAACFLRTAQWTRASLYRFCVQVFKGTRWMPWHQEPMKDVGACDMPRGVGNQTLIRGFPNGVTQHPSWGVAAI